MKEKSRTIAVVAQQQQRGSPVLTHSPQMAWARYLKWHRGKVPRDDDGAETKEHRTTGNESNERRPPLSTGLSVSSLPSTVDQDDHSLSSLGVTERFRQRSTSSSGASSQTMKARGQKNALAVFFQRRSSRHCVREESFSDSAATPRANSIITNSKGKLIEHVNVGSVTSVLRESTFIDVDLMLDDESDVMYRTSVSRKNARSSTRVEQFQSKDPERSIHDRMMQIREAYIAELVANGLKDEAEKVTTQWDSSPLPTLAMPDIFLPPISTDESKLLSDAPFGSIRRGNSFCDLENSRWSTLIASDSQLSLQSGSSSGMRRAPSRSGLSLSSAKSRSGSLSRPHHLSSYEMNDSDSEEDEDEKLQPDNAFLGTNIFTESQFMSNRMGTMSISYRGGSLDGRSEKGSIGDNADDQNSFDQRGPWGTSDDKTDVRGTDGSSSKKPSGIRRIGKWFKDVSETLSSKIKRGKGYNSDVSSAPNAEFNVDDARKNSSKRHWSSNSPSTSQPVLGTSSESVASIIVTEATPSEHGSLRALAHQRSISNSKCPSTGGVSYSSYSSYQPPFLRGIKSCDSTLSNISNLHLLSPGDSQTQLYNSSYSLNLATSEKGGVRQSSRTSSPYQSLNRSSVPLNSGHPSIDRRRRPHSINSQRQSVSKLFDHESSPKSIRSAQSRRRAEVVETLTQILYSKTETPAMAEGIVGCLEEVQGRVNQYLILKELGRGSYGVVHLCREEGPNGNLFACKTVSKDRIRKKYRFAADPLETVKREIAVLKKLTVHPNINGLVEVINDETQENMYMIFELCERGTLMNLESQKAIPFSENVARLYFRDIVLGLEYLHSRNVIHSDIKPENLLLTADGTVQIADFGISQILDNFDDDSMKDKNATLAFTPPEALTGGECVVRGRKFDIWSLGVTLFALVHGYCPFHSDIFTELCDQICNMNPDINPDLSASLCDLMRGMMDKSAETRWTMEKIRNCSWVTSNGSDPLISQEENCAGGSVEISDEEVRNAFGSMWLFSKMRDWFGGNLKKLKSNASTISLNSAIMIQSPSRKGELFRVSNRRQVDLQSSRSSTKSTASLPKAQQSIVTSESFKTSSNSLPTPMTAHSKTLSVPVGHQEYYYSSTTHTSEGAPPNASLLTLCTPPFSDHSPASRSPAGSDPLLIVRNGCNSQGYSRGSSLRELGDGMQASENTIAVASPSLSFGLRDLGDTRASDVIGILLSREHGRTRRQASSAALSANMKIADEQAQDASGSANPRKAIKSRNRSAPDLFLTLPQPNPWAKSQSSVDDNTCVQSIDNVQETAVSSADVPVP